MTDDLAVLRVEAKAPPERRVDPLWLRGIKYVFVTAIEACVDVAQRVCSSEGWGPPSNNADAVRLLGGTACLIRAWPTGWLVLSVSGTYSYTST